MRRNVACIPLLSSCLQRLLVLWQQAQQQAISGDILEAILVIFRCTILAISQLQSDSGNASVCHLSSFFVGRDIVASLHLHVYIYYTINCQIRQRLWTLTWKIQLSNMQLTHLLKIIFP